VAPQISRGYQLKTETTMYRMFKTLPWLSVSCVLAITLACSDSPNAPSPSGASTGTSEAAPDGSTLKAHAPTPVSPINNDRIDSRKPTLVVRNASGKFVNRPYAHEFQLMTDSGNVVSSVTVSQEPTQTTWAYPEDLERDTPYRWRARAVHQGLVGPWSAQARFLTVFEKRAADPPPGQKIPFPGWAGGIVGQVAARRPDLLHRSCQDHGGTWEFLDLVVDTLRLEDSRFGYNCKRGNCNDPSKDIVAYHYGPGPDEGSADVYIIDVMFQHCGDAPSPAWIDQTGITISSGTIGRWTSRGRF
jgi:hypothetical protein